MASLWTGARFAFGTLLLAVNTIVHVPFVMMAFSSFFVERLTLRRQRARCRPRFQNHMQRSLSAPRTLKF